MKGKIEVDSGIYLSSSVVDIIESVNSKVDNLQNLINGFYVNPSFSSCTDFKDYSKFLNDFGIRMFHSMVPSHNDKIYQIISKYDYDSFQAKIIELGTTNYEGNELKELQLWNKMIRKQITENGIESIEFQMKEGEIGIYFRNFHLLCICKYLDHVYSLIT